MTNLDLIDLAASEIRRWLQGFYDATLEDAVRWEQLGLGRVRFVKGRPTWFAGPES